MLEHPSCSKQHSVLQFRGMESINEEGMKVVNVKYDHVHLIFVHCS